MWMTVLQAVYEAAFLAPSLPSVAHVPRVMDEGPRPQLCS